MKTRIIATGTITLDSGQSVAAVMTGYYYYDPGLFFGPAEACREEEEEWMIERVSCGEPFNMSHTQNMDVFSDAEYKQLMHIFKTEAERIVND